MFHSVPDCLFALIFSYIGQWQIHCAHLASISKKCHQQLITATSQYVTIWSPTGIIPNPKQLLQKEDSDVSGTTLYRVGVNEWIGVSSSQNQVVFLDSEILKDRFIHGGGYQIILGSGMGCLALFRYPNEYRYQDVRTGFNWKFIMKHNESSRIRCMGTIDRSIQTLCIMPMMGSAALVKNCFFNQENEFIQEEYTINLDCFQQLVSICALCDSFLFVTDGKEEMVFYLDRSSHTANFLCRRNSCSLDYSRRQYSSIQFFQFSNFKYYLFYPECKDLNELHPKYGFRKRHILESGSLFNTTFIMKNNLIYSFRKGGQGGVSSMLI